MWTYTLIAGFGILGCWARYGITNLVQAIYGRDFPYATLSINVGGSFLMGFVFIETLERLTASPMPEFFLTMNTPAAGAPLVMTRRRNIARR